MKHEGLRLRYRMAALGVAAVVCAMAVTGATAGSSASTTTIKLGNITAVAGLGGTFAGFQAGVKAFFQYYNDRGGIKGTKFDLIAIDDAGDPGKNASAARTLVQRNKVLAIVGEATIADTASQKYLQQQGIPVVGGWAASSSWHKPASNMFVSLEGPNIPFCPVWSSDQAKAMGIKSIAFLAQDFPSAIQDANCRAAAAKFQGVKQAGKRIDVSLTAVDYRPAVQEAIDSGAEALYFSTGVDGMIKGVQAGEQLGFEGLYIATQFNSNLVEGLKSAGLLDKVNGRIISAAFSLLPNDPAKYSAELGRFQQGIKKYQSKYASDVTAVSGWAAGKLFADAFSAVGADRAKIMKWISGQKAYKYGGLQGPFNYSTGSKPNRCLTRLEIRNGQIARATKTAAPPPKFNCGPLINYAGTKILAK